MILFSIVIICFTLCLLGLALIYSDLSLWIKSGIILTTIFSVLLQLFAVYNIKGMATDLRMPPDMFVLHTLVREPNESVKDSGSIFYVILDFEKSPVEPRMYSIPYTKESHQQAQNIQSEIEKNQGGVWVRQTKPGARYSLNDRIMDKIAGEFADGLGLKMNDNDYGVELNNQKNMLPPK
jgi:hypothetical protein